MRAASGLAQAVDWRVYFVTDTAMCGGPARVPAVAEEAVLGGVGVVQVRDKSLSDAAFLALAKDVVAANERAFDASGRRAAIVVNDRLPVAEELGLHFHQGQGDGDVREARRRLGPGLLIGLSISSEEELMAELADPTADTLGLSPLWATSTKTDTAPALGVDGTARLVRLTAGRATTLAIGGINTGNGREAIGTGVDGICVVSAIAASDDPRSAAQALTALWRKP